MAIKLSKFRSPESNARYTKQLFWDEQKGIPIEGRTVKPMFTLHDDYEGLINFRKEYVRDMDPTGYKTATRLLENYDHFLLLMKNCKWFREAKEEWDKELAAKMEQEATDVLRGIALNSDLKPAERTTAAKVLLGKAKALNTPEKGSVRRGRPTREEVEGELKRQAALTTEEEEDLKRIRIVKK